MTPIMQYQALAEKPTYVCIIIVFNRRSRKNTVTTTIDWFIAPGQARRVLCPIIILLNRLRGSFRLINSNTCSFIVSTITLHCFVAQSMANRNRKYRKQHFPNISFYSDKPELESNVWQFVKLYWGIVLYFQSRTFFNFCV